MAKKTSKQRKKSAQANGFWSWFGFKGSDSSGNGHQMSSEIEAISKQFKINDEAKRLGKLGLPAFHSKELTSLETELIRHINVQREQMAQNVEREISEIDRELTNQEHEFQKYLTHSMSAEFERKARQIMDTQGAWLKKLANNAIANIKDLDAFAQEHNLKRQADYPEKSQLFFRYTLLMALIVIEGILNASFFSEGVSTGLIGGFVYAASLALINIAGCFFIGKAGVRWLNHDLVYGKIIGSLSLMLAVLFLCTMALSIAHIREAMTLGLDNPTQAAWTIMQQSLLNFKDLMSWFLMMLTIGFGVAAVVDGLFIDDIFPGYGKIHRRAESAKEEFESEFEEIRLELEDLKQEKLDFIDQQVDTCNELLFATQKLIETKQGIIKRFEDALGDTEVVLYATIRKFRFENEIVREDGLIPAYFHTMPALNPVAPIKSDSVRASALVDKLKENIKNHEHTIDRQREEVYQVFEKYVSQLNHLKFY